MQEVMKRAETGLFRTGGPWAFFICTLGLAWTAACSGGGGNPGPSAAPGPALVRLFDRFERPGCEVSLDLVSFRQDLSKGWTRVGEGTVGDRYACALAFCPGELGAGVLTVDGKEVPAGPRKEGPFFELVPGAVSSSPGGQHLPIRLSAGEGASSKKVRLEEKGPVKAPRTRLLVVTLRGGHAYNRYPVLSVFAGKKRVFHAVIPHSKDRTYRIPFVQAEPSLTLRFQAGLKPLSIPVWDDKSKPAAKVQVTELAVQDPPTVVLEIPPTEGGRSRSFPEDRKIEFTWAGFLERAASPLEDSLRCEPSPALRRAALVKARKRGRRLGPVVTPGVPLRAPAGFSFPVRFEQGDRLSFSVGLVPSERNHVFVKVTARSGEGRSFTLVDEVVAQPLMDPDFMWREFSVGLPPGCTGKGALEFRFSEVPDPGGKEKGLRAGKDPWAYAVFGNPVIRRKVRSGTSVPPNAVIVCIDTLRADHLSCYGYPLRTSPELDRFAGQALCFENAVSTSSWTLPSHLAFLGGVPLGQQEVSYKKRCMTGNIPTLAEYLQDRGYETAAFVGGGYVSAEFGMDRGFDLFSETSPTVSSGFPRVARWLEAREPGVPFFLFFHFFDVHAPYGDEAEDPLRFFREAGERCDEDLVKQIVHGKYADESLCGRFKVNVSDTVRRHMVRLYDADIFHVDGYLGRFFELLRSLRLFDETTIIVTADHGEEFGEHGNWHHSKHLYREVLHVPLILKPPRRSFRKGRVEAPVSLLDLAPTLAALAGGKAPEIWFGRSLLEDASRRRGGADRRVWSENVIEREGSLLHMVAFQDSSMKYFRVFAGKGTASAESGGGGERQELYFLGPDPLEQVDLSSCYPKVLARFRRESLDFCKRVDKVYAGRPGRSRESLSPAVIERLRALGYMK